MGQLSVETVLGLIGLVILVGLAGELFFKRTGVPSVLFLMGFGVLLGPVLHLAEASNITVMAPYFGTLALLIILFDGGLNLQFMKVLKEAPLAVLFSLTVFTCTTVGIAAFYVWGLEGQWLHGLLLGAILGGTAAAIVIPVAGNLTSLREPAKVLLSLDSAFSEVFVVVIALAIMTSLTEPSGTGNVIGSLFHAFVDALLLATIAGALWARLLAWMQGQTLSYMLTLAAILVLYYVAELLGGNGAITILLFGLVLSNMQFLVGRMARPIRAWIGYELDHAQFELDEFLKRINEELSFLVRTFFYVLLGLIFDLSAMTGLVAAAGLGLFAVTLIVRWTAAELFGRITGAWSGPERRIVASMLPRGVATAVMAFVPITAGIPNTELFPLYALTVIALGVIYMTVAITVEGRLSPNVAGQAPDSTKN